MALDFTKVVYTDEVIVIYAKNLNDIQDALLWLDQHKQDLLTIDTAVTEGSANPVSGGAVYLAISQEDQELRELISQKQNRLTIDAAVTEGSANPVSGGAVYSFVDISTAALQQALNEAVEDLQAEMEELAAAQTAALAELAAGKAPVILNTASGEIASFSDGADGMPVKRLAVAINPVQDLHGYDSPWPAGGGKNKVKIAHTRISRGEPVTINGVTFTPTLNDAGDVISITANGTASARVTLILIDSLSSQLVSGDYIISGCPSGGSWNTYCLTSWDATARVTLGNDVGSGATITLDDTHEVNFALDVKSGVTVNNIVFNPMIRLASESDPTFAPYSNECPISGWTGFNTYRMGKNLLDSALCVERTIGGVTRTVNADGTIMLNGTNTTSSIWWKSSDTMDIPIKAGIYTASCSSSVPNLEIRLSFAKAGSVIGTFVLNDDDTLINVRFTAETGTVLDNVIVKSQLEIGSIATEWEPYQNETYSVLWQDEAGTVYGGTAVYNGDGTWTLTVELAESIFDGSEPWGSETTSSGLSFYVNLAASGKLPGRKSGGLYAELKCNGFKGSSVGTNIIYVGTSGTYLNLRTPAFADVTELKAAFAETPLQVVYPLATPLTYTLSTEELITTLKGANNVWADTGEITELEYCADTKLYIDQKIAAAVAAMS